MGKTGVFENINNTIDLACAILARFLMFHTVNYILIDSINGVTIVKIQNGKFYWSNGSQHFIKDVKLPTTNPYTFDELCDTLYKTVDACNYSRIEIRNNREIIAKVSKITENDNPCYKDYIYQYYPRYIMMYKGEFDWSDVPYYSVEILNLLSSIGIEANRIIVNVGNHVYIVYKVGELCFMLENGKKRLISTYLEELADIDEEKFIDDTCNMHNKLLELKIESRFKSIEIRNDNKTIVEICSGIKDPIKGFCGLLFHGNTIIFPPV